MRPGDPEGGERIHSGFHMGMAEIEANSQGGRSELLHDFRGGDDPGRYARPVLEREDDPVLLGNPDQLFQVFKQEFHIFFSFSLRKSRMKHEDP